MLVTPRGDKQDKGRLKVSFLPFETDTSCAYGSTILEAARNSGVYLESDCNGTGTCGKCRVQVIEGRASPWTDCESDFLGAVEKKAGYRLACKAKLLTDSKVLVHCSVLCNGPAEEKTFRQHPITLDPAIQLREFRLPGPAPEVAADRIDMFLSKALGQQNLIVSESVKNQLLSGVRAGEGSFSALCRLNREVIGVEANKKRCLLGVALDIGTTTIALYLCDLTDGRILVGAAITNPQVEFGLDVLSRLAYASQNHDNASRIRARLIEAVNLLIRDRSAEIGCKPQDIVDITVVGNTVMHHIFLGLDLHSLRKAPFIPNIKEPIDIKADMIGLTAHPGAYVHVLPIQAGFVGADSMAAVISEELHLSEDHTLLMDLGTNGELIAGNRDLLFACSCATGPALEGASIKSGMRAMKGAIDRVWIDELTFAPQYRTVGDGRGQGVTPSLRPKGICGSGIIDVIAGLYKTKLIEGSGAFTKALMTSRLRNGPDGTREFLLVPAEETWTGRDIVLNQKDIRQVQLAKAALSAGFRSLMEKLGITEFQRVLIAGAFGMHIDIDNAKSIGLIPPCDRDGISFVGNAAGRGAYLSLVDKEKRLEAERVARRIQHVQLAAEPLFQHEFVNCLRFPPLA
ncbi:MAG TPA: ferredoxin [Deltaproteobacteria bacterium]|nr:ferredoxin [Deltaproteobacteria bacterium]